MYLRSGFLIVGYAILFISRFIEAVIEMPFLVEKSSESITSVIIKSLNEVMLNWIWVALYFFLFQIEKINMTLLATNHQAFK
jgi:hypothetical protein